MDEEKLKICDPEVIKALENAGKIIAKKQRRMDYMKIKLKELYCRIQFLREGLGDHPAVRLLQKDADKIYQDVKDFCE